jgi:hypothetical protein
VDPWAIEQMKIPTFSVLGMSVDVTVNNAVCRGLSNMEVSDHDITGDTATFTAQLPNSKPAWAPVISKQLVLHSADVEISLDNADPLPAGITITVKKVQEIDGSFTLSVDANDDLSSLAVTFNKLQLNPGVDTDNIVIDLDIDSSFASTINHVLNEPAQLTSAIASVNKELDTQDTKDKLSKAATSAAQQALADLLGGGS